MRSGTLMDELKMKGLIDASRAQLWSQAADMLAAFDKIGRDGACAVVKVDGARENGLVYTVLLSGGPLGEEYFHKDGSDLPKLLEEAIAFYYARLWSK